MPSACYGQTVSNVQVKNLDADVHDQLRARAAAAGLTISEYVLELIRRDLRAPHRRQWLSDLASLPHHEFSRDEIADSLHSERVNR
ncbi:hypothetical protein BH10ACT2_BH10ACT2_16780 [soil metagenome]